MIFVMQNRSVIGQTTSVMCKEVISVIFNFHTKFYVRSKTNLLRMEMRERGEVAACSSVGNLFSGAIKILQMANVAALGCI